MEIFLQDFVLVHFLKWLFSESAIIFKISIIYKYILMVWSLNIDLLKLLLIKAILPIRRFLFLNFISLIFFAIIYCIKSFSSRQAQILPQFDRNFLYFSPSINVCGKTLHTVILTPQFQAAIKTGITSSRHSHLPPFLTAKNNPAWILLRVDMKSEECLEKLQYGINLNLLHGISQTIHLSC